MSAQRIYGERAERYAEHSSSGAIYLEYERPAIRALAGNVRGLSVFDLGCGPGDHFRWLLEGGAAHVCGADLSAKMLEICRGRFPGIHVYQLDLRDPWPFARDASFDLILSSLALHYVPDWTTLLREAHRALRPGGRFVASTHHPLNPAILELVPGYFGLHLVKDRFEIAGEPADVEYYHRPLSAIFTPIAQAGFRLNRVAEPPFNEAPAFLFLEAQREPRA